MHAKVVVVEASSAATLPVAKQALKLLWEETLKSHAGAQDTPGSDAAIARNLIRLTADMSEEYDLERGRCKPGQIFCRLFNMSAASLCPRSPKLPTCSTHSIDARHLTTSAWAGEFQKDLEGGSYTPAEEMEHATAASEAAGDDVQRGPAQESIHQELAGLFSQAHGRMEAVGTAAFFGS